MTSEKVNIPCIIGVNNSNTSESNNVYIKIPNKGNEYKHNNQVKYSGLYVRIKVDDHEYFKREGDNIITNHYITVSQAVLGAELNIRTLHGIKHVKLRRYKDKIVLMNEGINKKGKHIVKIIIKLPSVLNEEQERILKQICEFEKQEKNEKMQILMENGKKLEKLNQ